MASTACQATDRKRGLSGELVEACRCLARDPAAASRTIAPVIPVIANRAIWGLGTIIERPAVNRRLSGDQDKRSRVQLQFRHTAGTR